MVYFEEHLKKYPLMNTIDVLKLHLQGILGPAHLVGLVANVINNLEMEYDCIKDLQYDWDMIERVSDEYSRVYIKPYFEKYGDFSLLAKCFKKSAENKDTADYWMIIEKLKDDNRFDNTIIDEYINAHNPLIRHSSIYRENYHPHYLVIANKYLPLFA